MKEESKSFIYGMFLQTVGYGIILAFTDITYAILLGSLIGIVIFTFILYLSET